MCSPRPSSNVSLVGGWYWVSERGPGSQGWVIGAAEVRLGGVERIQEVRWGVQCGFNKDRKGWKMVMDRNPQVGGDIFSSLGEITGKPTVY